MKKVLRFFATAFALSLLYVATVIGLSAQTFTTLVNFDGTDGAEAAYMSLVQGVDGNFYGTTGAGGHGGTVFKINSQGTMTTLHDFCALQDCADGYYPLAGLVQATDGNFYGTTYYGGASHNVGTVFKITPGGTLTTLYKFCEEAGCPDSGYPRGQLAQGPDGNFYGTTSSTVFKITPEGTLTTLYTFCTQTGCPDGAFPYAGLVLGNDGNFYGTTESGGFSINYGTVYKITPGGELTTLHTFDLTDGGYPYAELIQATDGNFYGTTSVGGLYEGGTVFKITPDGTLTTIYNFCAVSGCLDGAEPFAGLVQANDGNFYGTTGYGGPNGNDGTVFTVTPEGELTTLHGFDKTDGDTVEGGLLQATNGIFYGTTAYGGANGNGTIFSLSVGLGPFVETLPTFGPVGRKVRILGTDLTGATSVTFNGTAATFTVALPTEIKTTVPTGATNGKVQVTTPSRTLTSNHVFRVRP